MVDILYWNNRRSAYDAFNNFDFGNKYKVYSIHDGIKRYELSFDTLGEAVAYAKRIY